MNKISLPVEFYIEKANRMYKKSGALQKRIAYLQEALRFHSVSWELYAALLHSYIHNGEYKKACQYAEKLVALVHTIPVEERILLSDQINTAVARYQTPEFHDSAVHLIEAAIRISPDSSSSYFNLGVLLINKKQFTRAEKVLWMGLKLNPFDSRGNLCFGRVFFDKEQYPEAITYFTTAIASKENPQAYFFRGISFRKMGNYAKATYDLEKALNLQPDEPMIYYELGRTFRISGQPGNAIPVLKKALSMNSAYRIDFQKELAFIYFQTGNLKKCIQINRQLLRDYPDDKTANYNLGFVLYENKDYAEAIHYFEWAIGTGMHDPEIYYKLGVCFKETNRSEQAIKYFKKVIAVNKNHWSSLSELGYLYFKNNELEKGFGYFKRAVEIKPQDYVGNYFLGLYYLNVLQKFEKAEEHFSRIMDLPEQTKDEKENISKRYLIASGIIHWKNHNFKKAREDFFRSTKLHENAGETEYIRDLREMGNTVDLEYKASQIFNVKNFSEFVRLAKQLDISLPEIRNVANTYNKAKRYTQIITFCKILLLIAFCRPFDESVIELLDMLKRVKSRLNIYGFSLDIKFADQLERYIGMVKNYGSWKNIPVKKQEEILKIFIQMK